MIGGIGTNSSGDDLILEVFAVTNESTGEDKASLKYQKMIDGMNLYTPERLSELMGSAGFTGMEIYRDEKRPWITVVGRKG